MANVANIVPPTFATYVANIIPTPCVLDSGPANINTGAASFRAPTPQPDPQHGSSIPLGPQRWPL